MPEEKPEILAVHKQRLEQFLKELGLWEPILKGELKCVTCGSTITKDNIGVIIPSGENIILCCSNHDCLARAIRQREVESEEVESEEVESEEVESEEVESEEVESEEVESEEVGSESAK
jgi:hypothetical protein